MIDNCLIVIPAIKKNAVIPDQLIKKLNGITLIQRAINTAKDLTINENILVLTDSEEISLIANRNNIKCKKDKNFSIDSSNIFDITASVLEESKFDYVFIFRANTPLVDKGILLQAYNNFLKDKSSTLVSVKKLDKSILKIKDDKLFHVESKDYYKELKAFYILSKQSLYKKEFFFKAFIIDNEKSIEIENYQTWWICEKILQQKRIVFNVIGSTKIGMGHIYHSLALAHEISDHEVIFVCDEKYEIAVDKIASMDYKVISCKNVSKVIINLNPDMLINDILDTDIDFIKTFKKHNIKIVNFEDLGDGTKEADLVINELYDEPPLSGDKFLWGYKYLALRDEFENARPHKFVNLVDSVLITFGGTDQNNLTMIVLKSIIDIVKKLNIRIYIVCGSGYLFKDKLQKYLDSSTYKNIELTFASGIISQIMEKTQIAFSSNGRTVYELAHMNIPSIVISHHEREDSHKFASLEKGFINLGIYDAQTTSLKVEETLKKLINDSDYRKLLFLNIKKYDFKDNKKNIVKKIMELL
ncbi:MAG: hypothetical protein COB17_09430 [Sulfurimonas sp.]|nr:MAG: hypothetical protein COB17_09430 [Sulfurimonas sp.]